MGILLAVIILGSLGLLFGIGLFIASKMFYVKVDARVGEVESVLPGANCGACGLAGCGALAKAIVHGSADVSICPSLSSESLSSISKIMGLVATAREKKVAVVLCQRKEAVLKYDYSGDSTCKSANMLFGGQYSCKFACLGFGDCVLVCPFDAMYMENGLPKIDEAKCTSCGKCVSACPKNVIELSRVKSFVHVSCRSKDVGRVAIKACKSACIACKKCEKICPFDAIHVVDNLAVIDYGKCTSCGKCVNECPTNAIENYRIRRKTK